MQFPGYWVKDANGKVIIRTATFDETELDPQTNWKEAWQHQDADSSIKGFVETGKALAHAARLIARNQGQEISDTEILALQSVPPLFQGGKCELQNLDDFRALCVLINSLENLSPKETVKAAHKLPDAADEISFK
ncbi:MAG: hypothetical protein ABIG70_01810 [Pseudomonadota bacterium]